MSLDEFTIEELKEIKEIVDCLIDFSQSNIIRSNFIEGFYKYTVNNRLYGSVRLFGAKSFRLTSNSPNLLNMPSTGSVYASAVKKCFQAEPGHIFYTVDLNALEERVLSNLSGDKTKQSIFLHDIDGHSLHALAYNLEGLEDYVELYKDIDNTSKGKYMKKILDNGEEKYYREFS